LQNVPWDQALDLILKTKGLDKRQIGNVLLVAPADEIAAREKLELETTKQIAELAPVRLDIIQVNYAKAGDIVGLIKEDKELISDRGFVSSDVRTNTISVRESTGKLEEIRRLVSTWDVPVRQVSIEARIVRAQTNVAENLGVRWGGAGYDVSGNNVFSVGGSQGAVGEARDAAGGGTGGITFPGALAVDLGVSGDGASSFAVGWGSKNFLVDLELSALETDGQAEVVSQPRVVTADRQTASIKSGEEIPYQEASSSGATSVSFKEAVLSLEVTPQITPDDKIIMDLMVNQDSRGEVTGGIPSINTNEVTTQVLVGNGETVVLGGIFQSEVATQTTKTPFLGDIPYLGRLFKRTEHINERSELLIFITPKIIKNDLIQ
jgi:type IV pilus assembly protein PilQ